MTEIHTPNSHLEIHTYKVDTGCTGGPEAVSGRKKWIERLFDPCGLADSVAKFRRTPSLTRYAMGWLVLEWLDIYRGSILDICQVGA